MKENNMLYPIKSNKSKIVWNYKSFVEFFGVSHGDSESGEWGIPCQSFTNSIEIKKKWIRDKQLFLPL